MFAAKGYHTCRVGDIAEEAGIAHGLLYHYFASKEEVLQTVFRENWSELLEAFDADRGRRPSRRSSSSRAIAKVLLRSWRDQPDLVRVMVREVARSPQLQGQVDEIRAVFLVIQRVIERGQADGSFRPELDARLASWIFYGGLEELLTGWVLGQLPDGDEEVARAERTVVDLVCGGLTRAAPQLPSELAAPRRAARRGREAGRAGTARKPRADCPGRRRRSCACARAARGRSSRRTGGGRARRRGT